MKLKQNNKLLNKSLPGRQWVEMVESTRGTGGYVRLNPSFNNSFQTKKADRKIITIL